MKLHITNLYNFNANDALATRQHRFANAGRELGFIEMGIFSYPVETDTYSELSKRLDGVIASLETDDFVFVQLPTRNGYSYEQLLLNKIKNYKNTKLVLILHDTQIFSESADQKLQSDYLALYKMADAVIAPSVTEKNLLEAHGISASLFCDAIHVAKKLANGPETLSGEAGTTLGSDYLSLCRGDFYLKKLLLDCIDTVFAKKSITALSSIPVAENEIHISFGLHDKTGNYSVWVGVTMQSIIEHTTSKICFHILHDETLNETNRSKLAQVAANGGHRVLFHPLDISSLENTEQLMGAYTIGAMFRILLPELLPELSKIIYLDADLLVTRDIRELWNTDISAYALAAVPDADVVSGLVRPNVIKRNEVPARQYFNSGVLYMNLQHIRKTGDMKSEILSFLERTKESSLPDQDALNYIYKDSTLLLDSSWNCFINTVRRNKELKLEQKIYHYVGTRCVLYYLTDVDRLYYETLCRTPWSAEDSRIMLHKTINRITDRVLHLEELLEQLAASDKKRIYYGEETFAMRNLYQLLSIHGQDYRIPPENGTESSGTLPCKDFSALKEESKGSFVVLVLPEAEREHALEKLEQLGLENGKDYFVIPRLSPPHKGGYM